MKRITERTQKMQSPGEPIAASCRVARPALIGAMLIGLGLLGAPLAEAGTTQNNNTSSQHGQQQSATTAYGTRTPTPPVGGTGAQQNATSTRALKDAIKARAAANENSGESGTEGSNGNQAGNSSGAGTSGNQSGGGSSGGSQRSIRQEFRRAADPAASGGSGSSAASGTARTRAATQGAAEGLTTKAAPSRESLALAAEAPDRNGFTRAGRSLQKHGSRRGSKWRQDDIDTNKPAAANARGRTLVRGVLMAPGTRIVENRHGGFDAVAEDGRVVRFNSDGSMQGFRE